ncbi:MAG TPA: response regulator transcription factor [Jatrophihabitans sp.]|nr:response regulator transcription factor [Jatrophihabitans sp.]
MPDVAIVDDHLLLAEALAANLAVLGVSASALPPEQATAAAVGALTPRLVLLDLDLGADADSISLIEALSSAAIPVLLMTGVTDRLRIAAAFRAGVIGYLAKTVDVAGVLAAVRRALAAVGSAAGRPAPLDPDTRASLLAELAAAEADRSRRHRPFDSLTEREAATLRQLCLGRSVHDIARAWFVSEATVRTHVRGVLAKLEVASQLAAVALAATSGWLAPPTAIVRPERTLSAG